MPLALVFFGARSLVEFSLHGSQTPPSIFQSLAQSAADLLLRLLCPALGPLLLARRPYSCADCVKLLVGPLQAARFKGGKMKPAGLLPHVAVASYRTGVRFRGRAPQGCGRFTCVSNTAGRKRPTLLAAEDQFAHH